MSNAYACALRPARPFIKWAGGKTRMLPNLLPLVPPAFGTYHEPFLGGGALFWALQPGRAVLSDANQRLVHTYNSLRDDPEGVIGELRTFPHDRTFFEQTRALLDEGADSERAARFIYVNRVGFNGLYRVNREGKFNVPFGKYKNPTICDAENLRACSRGLHGADVRCQDFSEVLEQASVGDLVYFDPPYLPISATSSFTGYTPDGFSLRDHVRLRDVAEKLANRRVHVIISNSAAPAIRALYATGFKVITVRAPRAISADGNGRAAIEELIIIASKRSSTGEAGR